MNEISNGKPAKARMATPEGTPPGLEVDDRGRPIPFGERTSGDQEKVRDHIAAELHGAAKNPEGEAETPSPMPRELPGTAKPRQDKDPEGRKGDTEKNGQG